MSSFNLGKAERVIGFGGGAGGGYGGGGYGGGGYGGEAGGQGGYGGGGYGGGGGGGGGCLRDLLLLNTGCCLAESLGCGMDLLLMGPSSWRRVQVPPGGRLADRLVAAVRLYQREVSPRRPARCRRCGWRANCSRPPAARRLSVTRCQGLVRLLSLTCSRSP